MSRPRWQPPHPDPRKTTTPQRVKVDSTPTSAARERRQQTRPWAVTETQPDRRACAWDSCENARYHDFPICVIHVLHIEDYVATAANRDTDLVLARAERRNRRDLAAQRTDRKREELTASRGAQPGWIYYIETDGKIKIGYSASITERLRAYTPGSRLLAVHPGTLDLEKSMHRQFTAHLVAGREWFRPDPEILAHCERVVAEHGDPARFAPRYRDPHRSKEVTAVRGWSGKRSA